MRILILFLILLASFFTPVLFANQENDESCNGSLSKIMAPAAKSFAFKDIAFRSYAGTVGTARKVQKLTESEYIELVKQDKIDPDVFLLVEKLPLFLELPMVGGVILNKPLSIEGTHIQIQADKMGIPLIYMKDAFNHPDLNSLVGRVGYFKLQINEMFSVEFSEDQPENFENTRPHVVLPVVANRTKMAILQANEAFKVPYYMSGSKFRPLAQLKSILPPNYVPDVVGLTPGYYETFLSRAVYKDQYLRAFIHDRLEDLHKTKDRTLERKLLLEIRLAILTAKIPGFFSVISKKLKNRFGEPQEGLSIRSNNEDEDLVSAGLFNSAHAKTLSSADISKAFRLVWSSMYFLRSYSIRHFWNWQERHLSMPLLIHPYVQGYASGTGSFSMKDGYVYFDANLVFGKESKATNPNSDSITSEVSFNNSGFFSRAYSSLNPIENAVGLLYKALLKKVSSDFHLHVYQPTSIDIEFLIGHDDIPVLLQYKARPSREAVLEVLTGHLKLEELERDLSLSDVNSTVGYEHAIRRSSLSFLADQSLKVTSGGRGLRYAVIAIQEKKRIIFWKTRTHSEVEDQLRDYRPNIQWLGSGHIQVYREDNVLFSQKITDEVTPEIFDDALKNEIFENPDLHKSLQGLILKIWRPHPSYFSILWPFGGEGLLQVPDLYNTYPSDLPEQGLYKGLSRFLKK